MKRPDFLAGAINFSPLSIKTPLFVDTQSILQFLSTKQGHVMDGKVSLFVKMPRAVLWGKRLRSVGFQRDYVHLKHKGALGLFCIVSDEELFLSLGMLVSRQQYEQERYA